MSGEVNFRSYHMKKALQYARLLLLILVLLHFVVEKFYFHACSSK